MVLMIFELDEVEGLMVNMVTFTARTLIIWPFLDPLH